MASCQHSTTASRRGGREKGKGREEKGKENPWWRLGCQDLNRGDTRTTARLGGVGRGCLIHTHAYVMGITVNCKPSSIPGTPLPENFAVLLLPTTPVLQVEPS